MNEPILNSEVDLLSWLKNQDIFVPARGRGRTKKHTERYNVYRLMATLASSFCYPIKVIHQDRPDFLLYSENRKIGIEVSEAVSEEEAAVDALAEKMGIRKVLFMDSFRRGTLKRTAKERRELLENPPMGDGFGDGGLSKDWLLSILDNIQAKTTSMRKPGFKLYNFNYLSIYDNLTNFADIRELGNELFSKLKNYWHNEIRYDLIFIESGNQLICLEPNKWNCQEINDIWRG